ncbi:MAG: efflux transporter periplasmic adaptor subunit [Methylophaga sp.]|nr:MAG: efflux transporter periplasmic adaptor subunit [Methylophaga sp.]
MNTNLTPSLLLLFLLVVSPLLQAESEPVQQLSEQSATPYSAEVKVPNAQLQVISAPLSGLLSALLVAEGDSISKGQILAVIHSPQLLQKQSAYLAALTEMKLAGTEKKRDQDLFKEGIIAERRFLESSAKYTLINTRVQQYRQALKLSGMNNASLAKLNRTHNLTATLTIKAPLSGIVLEQLATPGIQVDVLTPIYKVAHLKPLWLEIQVPLEQLGTIKEGTPINIVGSEITGKVITVGQRVQGVDQSVLVRAEVTKGAEQLRPGQFVQVFIR